MRRDKDCLQCQLYAPLESVALCTSGCDEFQQTSEFLVADRAAVGPRGEPAENLLGGRVGRRFLSRRDEKNTATRFRVGPRLVARFVPGDCVGRDLLGCSQVLLHQQRREREHVADVVEPVAHVVGGEIGGGVELDPQQVADGVGIFRTVQTPDRHPARIGGAGRVGLAERGFEPGVYRVIFRVFRPAVVLGRHLASAEHSEHLAPCRLVLRRGLAGVVFVQLDTLFGVGPAMAIQAIPLDERQHGGVEGLRHRGGRLGGLGGENHRPRSHAKPYRHGRPCANVNRLASLDEVWQGRRTN